MRPHDPLLTQRVFRVVSLPTSSYKEGSFVVVTPYFIEGGGGGWGVPMSHVDYKKW